MKLCQSCVVPVMDYCSGAWGFAENADLDGIQARAARCFLGVNRYAPKLGTEGDMGWDPPEVRRKIEMLRLWNRVVGMDDGRLPKIMYKHMLTQGHPWLQEVKSIFSASKTTDVYERNVPIVNVKVFLTHVKGCLLSLRCTAWSQSILLKPKLAIYSQHKTHICTEDYCKVNLKRGQRSLIAKMRLGVFPINVEIGRYNNIPRSERYCQMCDLRSVEDEIHVLLYCPSYTEERNKLFIHACLMVPNFKDLDETDQVWQLLSHINIIRKTSCFLATVLNTRQELLRVTT